MDSNSNDTQGGSPESHPPKPMTNKLLPWAVLLLAALALLYFLNKGCNTAKTAPGDGVNSVGESTGTIMESIKGDQIKTREVLKSNAMDGNKVASEQKGGNVVSFSLLKEALVEGVVNPNDAYILDEVHFMGNTANLSSGSTSQLEQLVELSLLRPQSRLRIEAHTDNRGTADMNVQLSAERANAIKTFLLNNGIDASRVATVGRGQVKPLVPNDTEQGRARNNRIEVYLNTN